MIIFKNVFSIIIIIVLMFQFGNLILKKTNFEDIFKRISGILIVTTLFSLLSSCKISNLSINKDYNFEKSAGTNKIIDKFQSNLNSIIKNDLHNTFYVNYFVDVKTDLKTLKICISGDFEANYDEIKTYVYNKYCTGKDEVILINEVAN